MLFDGVDDGDEEKGLLGGVEGEVEEDGRFQEEGVARGSFHLDAFIGDKVGHFVMAQVVGDRDRVRGEGAFGEILRKKIRGEL